MTRPAKVVDAIFLVLFAVQFGPVLAGQIDIVGPPGSGTFGTSVQILDNGNFLVVDPTYSVPGGAASVGAVYLYGSTGSLISTLTGSTANDQIGSGGIDPEPTNPSGMIYFVKSPHWSNAGAANAGAVTLINSSTGLNGAVSAANSLVGTSVNDQIGLSGIAYLFTDNATNFIFLIRSPNWTNAGAANAGAITYFDPATPLAGTVSPANSLVGSSANDQVGNIYPGTSPDFIYNYIATPNWSNGAAANAGAFTQLTHPLTGPISAANSLVGSSANDKVGGGGVAFLKNGNIVVSSPNWTNNGAVNAGAATWAVPANGLTGVVSAANSLVGTTASDFVSAYGIFTLKNGNYVVDSSNWSNGGLAVAGAVTLCNGATGMVGPVSASNSLVGGNANDNVGNGLILFGGPVTELPNGNYLVHSGFWNNGCGAVTFCNGTTGVIGAVSASNSLVGSTPNPPVGPTTGDLVGDPGIQILTNGNYVVSSLFWHNGAASSAGAVTWGSGTSGVSGVVSSANSLVSATQNSFVGQIGITPLVNGNYVVPTLNWCAGFSTYEGAVTWGDGTIGVHGVISSSNSLVGPTPGCVVGAGVYALPNGNYVVGSPGFQNGPFSNAGAVTLVNGSTGISGFVSTSNSLVGSHAGDQVGGFRNSQNIGNIGTTINVIPNTSHLIVQSLHWANNTNIEAGALTFSDGVAPLVGPVSASNSLLGSSANDNISGGGISTLSNGNFLIRSPNWSNTGAAKAGAVTFWNANGTPVGPLSAANSLVGTTANDNVGLNISSDGKGNFAIASPNWSNAGNPKAGAVTFANIASGLAGVVSASNSLVGTSANDQVGLTVNSNSTSFLIGSPNWSNGKAAVAAGAVTWVNSSNALTGPVTAANSLIGINTNDNLGSLLGPLYSDNYFTLTSANCSNGAIAKAGAVTLGLGALGTVGPVNSSNTVFGTTANGGSTITYSYIAKSHQLVVGRPADNIVTIFGSKINLPLISSGPTAAPNPALVGQTVMFSASASGGAGGLQYSWNFGDGSPAASGSTVSYAYSAAGTFTATVTVTDSAQGTVSGTVQVTVTAPATGCTGSATALVGSGPDGDCDGFSDAFETAVGFNPADGTSNPVGRPITIADLNGLVLTKASVKLNFKKSGKDSIQISGTVPVPAGFVAAGSKVYFDVGGVAKVLTLTAKNSAKNGNDSAKFSIKTKKHKVLAQTAKFSAAFKNGSFAATLAAAGLANSSVKKVPVTLTITCIFNNLIYQKAQAMTYSAKKGSSGSAASVKGK